MQNIAAATAALLFALPARQRLSASDLVLPADSFSNSYVLCQTLAALISPASVAINSVAGPGVDLALATRNISPTVVIASPETLSSLHQAETARLTSGLQKLAHSSQTSVMSAGRMPSSTLVSNLFGAQSSMSATPGKLRLILVSERANTDAPKLSSAMLCDLRVFTRARICYALTASRVAGAVAQTNLYDYRMDTSGHSHFGVPVSSVEVKLANRNDKEVDENAPRGEIVVAGPSVAGGEAKLGVQGTFREDCTLAYA